MQTNTSTTNIKHIISPSNGTRGPLDNFYWGRTVHRIIFARINGDRGPIEKREIY